MRTRSIGVAKFRPVLAKIGTVRSSLGTALHRQDGIGTNHQVCKSGILKYKYPMSILYITFVIGV